VTAWPVRSTTVTDIRERVATLRRDDRRVALVPTMGALHEGHLSLVRAAAELADEVVVSVFVNPLQFGPGEDFDAYPRDLDRDERALDALGPSPPAIVYAPDVTEMYPDWVPGGEATVATTVSVTGVTGRLEGEERPGHFDGVCTVVLKLFNQVRPDVACFGRKDFQQLVVIRRMVADLDVPVEVVGRPTVREADGLAMSSRNAYLVGDDRVAARALSRALAAAVRTARRGREAGRTVPPTVLREAARATLEAEPRARTGYVEVVDPDTFEPPHPPDGTDRGEDRERELLVAVAARVGPARLVDNVVIGDRADEQRLLDAAG
jgi:pantoate--beta-alanine ligase